MSGIYNHRPMVPGRSAGVPEWLDLIKQEFDTLGHEAMVAKAQREECEHKSMYPLAIYWKRGSQSQYARSTLSLIHISPHVGQSTALF
jgi:hypothetical protein